MSGDAGKILYETHEEVLSAAVKSKDTEIRDLKKIIARMRVKIKGLEALIGEMPQGPIEFAKKILK